jgi:hypothetical protein
VSTRLERIAALAPAVSIYRMEKGVAVWQWLCSKHLAERVSEGFEAKEIKTPPHPLNCELCPLPPEAR